MLVAGAIAGSYRIVGMLGEGGMGVVYVAEHVVLGSRAAVKILHGQAAASAEIVQRFVNEARASAMLKHRNIVQVYDCGHFADGQWFIALEFLDGAPLSKFIASHGGPLALPTIVQILAQAANGLHVAHEHGIVHRDVKPDNLYLTRTQDNDHHVTILDFGIAKLGDDPGRVRTRTNVAMGTPAYMAPEQLRDSKTVDRRSDVYALGAIAFEMATGRYLWGGESNPVTIYDWQRTTPRPDPRVVRADTHAAVAEVISRALAFDPAERWQSAQEFALALAHAAPGTEWSESGMDILRRYANELTPVAADADTVGRRVPSVVSHAGPASGSPLLATPCPIGSSVGGPVVGAGRARDALTVPLAGQVPAPNTTTIGGSVGQSVRSAARQRRKPLVLGAVAVLGATATVLAMVRPTEPAASAVVAGDGTVVRIAEPRISAISIVTDPPGGAVSLDGVPQGVAPIAVAAPVGALVTLRAELEGHAADIETVRVTVEPMAVRLELLG